MDRGAWQATVHGVAEKSDTTEGPTLLLSQGIRRAGITVRTDPNSGPRAHVPPDCHHHPHGTRWNGEQRG